MGANELRLLVGTVVLMVVHLSAPRLLRLRERVAPTARSFAGGMAVAYVFVHLLPELDLGHAILGPRIHLVVLTGFLVVYGIEHLLVLRFGTEAHGHAYPVRLTVAALYNGLIVYTLGTQVPGSLALAVVYLLSLSMHVVSMDHGLDEHFGHRVGLTRTTLLVTIGAGALVASVSDGSSLVVDLSTAFLAGFMMFNVFREELPEAGSVRLRWFLTGALAMVTSTMLTE